MKIDVAEGKKWKYSSNSIKNLSIFIWNDILLFIADTEYGEKIKPAGWHVLLLFYHADMWATFIAFCPQDVLLWKTQLDMEKSIARHQANHIQMRHVCAIGTQTVCRCRYSYTDRRSTIPHSVWITRS